MDSPSPWNSPCFLLFLCFWRGETCRCVWKRWLKDGRLDPPSPISLGFFCCGGASVVQKHMVHMVDIYLCPMHSFVTANSLAIPRYMMNLKQKQAEAYAQKLKRFFMTLDSSGWKSMGHFFGQLDLVNSLPFCGCWMRGISSCREGRNSDPCHQIEVL